jgi:glycosyltransferase involved in cell wall biosynthesis
MSKTVYFISPTYNASYHLNDLYDSLKEQSNKNWHWIILNDMSNDDTLKIAKKIEKEDKLERVTVFNHTEKKFALKGIYDILNTFEHFSGNEIIAIIDGDDALCNENTVSLILKEYKKNKNLDALWTSHSWDINGLNISQDLPTNINPYQYPWVSSHLKTFSLSVFRKINLENFKDLDNCWFERGYDQAIYLPILYLAREHKFLDEICYLYRINSNSLKVRDWKEKSQMDTIRLVRARGFVE